MLSGPFSIPEEISKSDARGEGNDSTSSLLADGSYLRYSRSSSRNGYDYHYNTNATAELG